MKRPLENEEQRDFETAPYGVMLRLADILENESPTVEQEREEAEGNVEALVDCSMIPDFDAGTLS